MPTPEDEGAILGRFGKHDSLPFWAMETLICKEFGWTFTELDEQPFDVVMRAWRFIQGMRAGEAAARGG